MQNPKAPQYWQTRTPTEAMNNVHYSFLYDGHSCFLQAMCGHNGHTKALEKMGECNWLRVPVHDAFGNWSLQHGMGDSLWSVSELPSSSAQTAVWRTLRENLVSGGGLVLGVVLRYSRLCVGRGGLAAHCPNKRQAALCALWRALWAPVWPIQFLNSPFTYQHLCFSFDMFYYDRAFLYSLGRPGAWYVSQAGSSFEITGIHYQTQLPKNVVFYS